MNHSKKHQTGEQLFSFLENNPYICMVLLTAFLWLPNMATMPLSIMEARNFITAREMVQDDNWILTTLNGIPRYEKPPLPTWLTALAGMIFGFKHLFFLRMPVLFMALFLAVFTFRFCEMVLKNRTQSILASVILISSFYTLGIAFEAPADIFTHGFMMAAIFYLSRVLLQPRKKWRNVVLSGLLMGCSILSKGPVSLYVLFLPFMMAFGIQFKQSHKNKLQYLVALAIIALVTGGWWYFYVHLKDPGIFSTVAHKETTNWSEYNVKPFYYYWSFFAETGIWAIPAFIGLLYPFFKNRIRAQQNYRFTFTWTVAAVVLLSIIPEKKTRYLMPVLIPLAINTSFYVKYFFDRFKEITVQWEKSIVYFNFGLIGIICLLLPVALCLLLGDETLKYMPFLILYFSMLLFAGTVMIKALIHKNTRIMLMTTLLVSILVYGAALPLYSLHTRSNSTSKIADIHIFAKKNQLIVYGDSLLSPEFIWYFGSTIPIMTDETIKNEHCNVSRFGLIANSTFMQSKREVLCLKKAKKIHTIDINPMTIKGKTHAARFLRTFYLIDNTDSLK